LEFSTGYDLGLIRNTIQNYSPVADGGKKNTCLPLMAVGMSCNYCREEAIADDWANLSCYSKKAQIPQKKDNVDKASAQQDLFAI
jgi:hypothetical protein